MIVPSTSQFHEKVGVRNITDQNESVAVIVVGRLLEGAVKVAVHLGEEVRQVVEPVVYGKES